MYERVVLDEGRKNGYVKATCSCCGYTAYIHGSEFTRSKGHYGFGMAYTACGNPDCKAKISVSVTCIPDDVEIPN